MNIHAFKKLFGEQLPLELGYGYTCERNTLYIILYEDKVSRIVTDSDGNVLERIDQVDDIDVNSLLQGHKRFYPNRVNPTFVDFVQTFGGHLSITNTDAVQITKKFDFDEVYIESSLDEMEFNYFLVDKDHIAYQNMQDALNKDEGRSMMIDFSFIKKLVKKGSDIFVLTDKKRKLRDLPYLIKLSQSEFESK